MFSRFQINQKFWKKKIDHKIRLCLTSTMIYFMWLYGKKNEKPTYFQTLQNQEISEKKILTLQNREVSEKLFEIATF